MLTNPDAVSVEIKKYDGTEITLLTEADTEVSIGATLGDDLARDLGLDADGNAAEAAFEYGSGL